MSINSRIQLRRGTSAEWALSSTILASGEAGYDIDQNNIKIGNGASGWANLPWLVNANSLSGQNTYAATGNFDVISFDTSYEGALTQGQISWDATEGTMDIGLTDTATIHVGEHRFFRIRNETGSTLYKGQVVYATGVHANGIIEPSLYVADGSVREVRFMGVVLEDVSVNNNGFVIDFGHIENIDLDGSVTNFAVGDETWSAGDLLYVHPTVPGKLTNVEPTHDIVVAIILSAGNGNGNGRMFVRPTSYGHLNDSHDVNLNGLADNNLLVWNSGTEYWRPSSGLYYVDDKLGIGTSAPNSTLHVYSSVAGEDLLNVEGSNGSLFSVVDSLSGTLMSVNTAAGLPALEVNSDYSLTAGRFNQSDFVITSGGSIGVGTASPSGKFNVVGDSYFYNTLYIHNTGVATPYTYNKIYTDIYDSLVLKGGDSTLTLSGQGGSILLDAFSTFIDIGNSYNAGTTNQYIRFTPANSEAMRITNDGKVGIGTSAPTHSLTINPTSSTPSSAMQSSSGSSASLYSEGATLPGLLISMASSNSYTHRGSVYMNRSRGTLDTPTAVQSGDWLGSYYGAGFDGTNLQRMGGVIFTVDGDVSTGSVPTCILFQTGSSSRTEKMRITSGGNFGIGTQSPLHRLDVVGTGNFSGDVYASGNLGVGTSSPNATIHGYSATSGAMVLNVEGTYGSLFSVRDNLSGVLMNVNTVAGLPALEIYDDYSLIAGRYNQNDFVVSSSGNVGIGTASPQEKLHVEGDITLGNTAGSKTDWNRAFYVFNDPASMNGYGLTLGGQASTNRWSTMVFAPEYSDIAFKFDGSNINHETSGQSAFTSALLIRGDNKYVGVGTESPVTKLDVSGVITASGGNSNEWNQSYDWVAVSGGLPYVTGAGTANQVAFFNDTDSITSESNFYWDSANNRLGINNSTPVYTLDVTGNGHFTTSIKVEDNIYLGSTDSYIYGSNNSNYIRFYDASDWIIFSTVNGGAARFDTEIVLQKSPNFSIYGPTKSFTFADFYSSTYDGYSRAIRMYQPIVLESATPIISRTDVEMRIDSNNDSTTNKFFITKDAGTELFRIQEDGKVGIGITNPQYTLDVNGTSNLGGNVIVGGNLTVNGSTVSANIDTLDIKDPILTLGLASGNVVVDDSYDRGIAMVTNSGTAFMGWDNSADKFVMLASGVATNSSGNYDAGAYGDLVLNKVYGSGLNSYIQFNSNNTNSVLINSDSYTGSHTYINTQYTSLNAVSTYVNGTLAFPKTATATSTATQKNSRSITLFNSMWNGSAELQTNVEITSLASTTVNERSRLAFLTSNEDGTNNKVERLSILTDGNVGVGTTSPSEKLHVYGTGIGEGGLIGNAKIGVWEGNIDYLALTHNSVHSTAYSYALLQRSDGSTFLNAASNKDLSLRINNTDAILIKSDRSVRMPGNSTNTTWTSASSTLALKNVYSSPFISFHTDGGARIGYFQMDSTNAATLGVEQNLPLRFTTNNLERMRIDSVGNVGIGTSTPNELVEVSGHIRLSDTAVSQGNIVQFSRGGGARFDYSIGKYGTALAISTARDAATQRHVQIGYHDVSNVFQPTVSINSYNGNFGIGTVAPASMLSIVASGTGVYDGTLNVAEAHGLDIYNTQQTSDGSYASLTFRVASNSYGSVGTASVNCVNTGNGNGDLAFVTRDNAVTSEKMRIAHNGDVGIGTSSPAYRLHVVGAANNWTTRLTGSSTTSQSNGLDILAGTDSVDTALRVRDRSQNPLFIVRGDGNVGIGTTSPTQKLDIRYPASGGMALIKSTDSNDGLIFGDIDPLNAGFQGFKHANMTGNSEYLLKSAGQSNYISAGVNGSVYIRAGNDNSSSQFTVKSTEAVYNDAGTSVDFRVESDNNEYMLFVDGSADKVGIGTSTLSVNQALTLHGGLYFDNNADGLVYSPLESSSNVERYFIMFDKTNNASYPFLTNRTPSGKVVIKTGTAAGGGENTHFSINGGDGTVNAYFENANVGIGTASPSTQLDVSGSGNFSGDVTIDGHLSAATKSFLINHPTREGHKLQYGSLESPYHGVRLTGRSAVQNGVCVVKLPEYISELVHNNNDINIQITNIKHGKILYVDDINIDNNEFTVKTDAWLGTSGLEFFWTFTAVRKDVKELQVEF